MIKNIFGKNWLYLFVLIILITRVMSVHVHGHIAPDGHEHDSHHGGHVSSLMTEGLQHSDHHNGEFNIEIDHDGVVKNLSNLDLKLIVIAFVIFGLWQLSLNINRIRFRKYSNKQRYIPPYLPYLQLRAPPAPIN